MRFIHTADWHIGQSFYEYDRKAEHTTFFHRLKEIVKEHCADALLIAGDVFDSPNPSAESQKIYYTFLREITSENPHLQIIITAGNHDSAARLEAPNALLEDMNVVVKGIVRRTAEGAIDLDHLVVPLNGGGYCLAVPYLRQGDYPDAESYSKGVKAMYDALFEAAQSKASATNEAFAPIIAMGHLQATGSEISENDRSERTIIGGLECVSPEAFADGITYTALGHLHRGQRVSGHENIRYSGTPIPMSFAEKNNRQGVVLVEIDDDEPDGSTTTLRKGRYNIRFERIEFEDAVRLVSIPHEPMPLADVLNEIRNLPDGEINHSSPYLEIKVLIIGPEPSMRHQIEEALKGKSVRLARVSASTKELQANGTPVTYEELQTINPIEMANKIFGQQYGGESMPDAMKSLLQQVVQEVER